MRRRRQQKLEKKLIQFRSKDGGPDTGGTLKIYGEALCKEVPYKTLLLSVRDTAAFVVEEMLEKYGLDRKEAPAFCLVQVTNVSSNGDQAQVPREYYLEDDECPLAILMNHPPSRGKNEISGCYFKGKNFLFYRLPVFPFVFCLLNF
jgi:afadin